MEPDKINDIKANDLDVLTQQKHLEIKIGQKYSFDELTDIWIVNKKKQGTYFNALLAQDEIILKCSGKEIDQTNTIELNVLIDVKALMQNSEVQRTCSFHLKFIVINMSFSDEQFEEKVLSQCEDIKFGVMKEKNLKKKSFILETVDIKHSKECIASDNHFVYQRNDNFIKDNQDLLEKLIHKKYLEDNQKPKYPKDYTQYTKTFFGFDYLFYGFGQSNKKQQKLLKEILKKAHDNIVARARKSYKMRVTPTKSPSKKRKANFRLSKQDQQQGMNIQEKNQEKRQLKSYLKKIEDEDEDDSEYEPKFRKTNSQLKIEKNVGKN